MSLAYYYLCYDKPMTEKREEGQQQEKNTMASSPLLRGEIFFDKNNVKSFAGATVYVRLEDVTMQDAPSKLILQQVIKGLSYGAGADDIAGHYHHQKKSNLHFLMIE
jgi:hypothetical protein